MVRFKCTAGVKAVLIALPLALAGCDSDDNNTMDSDSSGDGGDMSGSEFTQPTSFTGFPVTLADATGETSVSYTGQMARHVLREQMKATLAAPTAEGYGVITEVNNYIDNPDNVIDSSSITAPANKEGFTFTETINSDLGTGRNLSGKLFDPAGYGDPMPGVSAEEASIALGWPGNLTAREVVELWVNYVGAINAGSVPVADPTKPDRDTVHGYMYSQLAPKFMLGAVFFNQSVDKYLDEYMTAEEKPNNLPYGEGKIYTGKEHSWDEGFGYFGAAANYGELTADQNYEVSKRGKNLSPAEAAALADANGDGTVSLYTEYTSGPAYYAASFDRDGLSTYGADITNAFLEGRTLIANALDENGVARVLTDDERSMLLGYADTVRDNWEMVFAEAVYKYAGLTGLEADSLELGTGDFVDYMKYWSELKGFMMSLQYGGSKSMMNKAKFIEIDTLIGYGPVLQDGKQVNGLVEGERGRTYTFSEGNSLSDYRGKMLRVQELVDEFYGLKAKQSDLSQ